MRWPVVFNRRSRQPEQRDDEVSDLSSYQQQTQTPIKLLSDDLFVYILTLVISGASDFMNGPPIVDLQDLHTINSVCRHWRWTALNTHSFWSFIPTYLTLDNLSVFLRRSGDAPLLVDVICERYTTGNPRLPLALREDTKFNVDLNMLRREEEVLTKLGVIFQPAYRGRVHSLTLRLSASMIKRLVSTYVGEDCRTPALERLRFHCTDIFQSLPVAESEAQHALFTKFRSASLSELHLQGVSIPSHAIPFSSLKTLSVSVVPWRGADLVGREYFRGLLKNGDFLVSLSLEIWALPVKFEVAEISGESGKIDLPQLRRLTLKGPCAQSLKIYQLFSAPSLEQIDLQTRYTSLLGVDKFVPSAPPGDTIFISVDYSYVRLDFKSSVGSSSAGRFQFTHHSLIENGNTKLTSILQTRHLKSITSVDLSVACPIDLGSMDRLLERFESLDSLRLTYTVKFGARPSVEDTVSLSMLRSPLSSLRSLRSLVFRNYQVKIPQATPFLIGLCGIVRERGKSGLPLVLEFEDCQGVTDDLLRACGLKS